MPLPLDDNVVEDGFCWGLYEVTVDRGPRIRLPAGIIKVLESHKVKELWLYPDPTGRRLIICPEQNRPTYIAAAKQNLPDSMEPDEAYRKFICAGEAIPFRGHGRISIAVKFNRDFKAEAGQQVVIVGTGPWYELWRQDDWFDACEGKTKE
jgi:DNA-binding transcriptional regulator/RsmH inhibitor MraZ